MPGCPEHPWISLPSWLSVMGSPSPHGQSRKSKLPDAQKEWEPLEWPGYCDPEEIDWDRPSANKHLGKPHPQDSLVVEVVEVVAWLRLNLLIVLNGMVSE